MKEMKKYFILILTVFILLLLSIKQYSFDVSVKVDKQTYDKGATITLFRNDKGDIFGGYLPISWKNNVGYQNENRCFIFTLTNIYNIHP